MIVARCDWCKALTELTTCTSCWRRLCAECRPAGPTQQCDDCEEFGR